MTEYNFYQIDHTGVNEPDLDGKARTDVDVPLRRSFDSKISLFGSKNVGGRMSSDYTRTLLDFASKDELADHNVQTEDTGMGDGVSARSTTVEHNPYVIGSTVKRVRDEQAFRMGMTDNRGNSVNLPAHDVSDKDLVDPSGMTAGKNWPSEGWRSYGGKYHFSYPSYEFMDTTVSGTTPSGILVEGPEVPYQGGGIH